MMMMMRGRREMGRETRSSLKRNLNKDEDEKKRERGARERKEGRIH